IKRAQIDRRIVHRASVLRGRGSFGGTGDSDHLHAVESAQRQSEGPADQAETNDANAHQAGTPACCISAAATASTCATGSRNAAGVIDCAPSKSARSGWAWTSTISP